MRDKVRGATGASMDGAFAMMAITFSANGVKEHARAPLLKHLPCFQVKYGLSPDTRGSIKACFTARFRHGAYYRRRRRARRQASPRALGAAQGVDYYAFIRLVY